MPLTFFHITEGLLEDLVSPLGPVLLFLQLLQLDGHAANIGQSIILQPKQKSGQFCLIILQDFKGKLPLFSLFWQMHYFYGT